MMKKIEDKKELTSIELVFENCEDCKIPIKFVEFFVIDDITESLRFQRNNYLHSHESAEYFYIKIDKKWAKTTEFITVAPQDKPQSVLERLKPPYDICCVQLNFKDKTERYIYLPFGGNENEYINGYQTVNADNNDVIIKIERIDDDKSNN